MQPPGFPENEALRLEELRALDILDTIPEAEYDDLAALASHICGTPIALVSLVDHDRQWFKAAVGLDAPQTPRDISFCGHAVEGHQLLVVPDTLADVRFADNPLVTDAPDIRFYAGTPLITKAGHALGTLCVIDRVPRQLADAQVEMLEALGRSVVRAMEMRKANFDLVEARAEAEAASRAKSTFLATMSHELRTPLNSIIGFSSLLSKNRPGNISDSQLTHLERIRSNGVSLLLLINDVLDLSKVEAGHIVLERKPTDLVELARRVVDHTDSATCTVTYVGPNSIPLWDVDPRRIRQVLTNLLANAIRFSEDGQVEVRLQVLDGQAVSIDVADSGPGIADEDIERVFAAFEQASTGHQRTHEGTGLGLPIAQRLARLHGFEIEAASILGVGSTFRLRLSDEAPPLEHLPPRTTKRKTVLLVDADAQDRASLALELEQLGYHIIATDTGEHADSLARAVSPDAAVVTLQMQNGWDIIRRLREARPNMPIVACNSKGTVGPNMDGVELATKDTATSSLVAMLDAPGIHRVLIVDDDPGSRALASAALAGSGVEILLAENGPKALARISQGGVDAVVLDLSMPGMDGFAVLEAIRSNPDTRDLPVVLWTAMDVQIAENLPVAGVLAKAGRVGELADVLEELFT